MIILLLFFFCITLGYLNNITSIFLNKNVISIVNNLDKLNNNIEKKLETVENLINNNSYIFNITNKKSVVVKEGINLSKQNNQKV